MTDYIQIFQGKNAQKQHFLSVLIKKSIEIFRQSHHSNMTHLLKSKYLKMFIMKKLLKMRKCFEKTF